MFAAGNCNRRTKSDLVERLIRSGIISAAFAIAAITQASEDVTAKAGVEDQGPAAGVWKQGATFVDVNNDGLLDIYVCRFKEPNLLYINQGNGTFKEMAHTYGLDVRDACVMAAFCDYDRDG